MDLVQNNQLWHTVVLYQVKIHIFKDNKNQIIAISLIFKYFTRKLCLMNFYVIFLVLAARDALFAINGFFCLWLILSLYAINIYIKFGVFLWRFIVIFKRNAPCSLKNIIVSKLRVLWRLSPFLLFYLFIYYFFFSV